MRKWPDLAPTVGKVVTICTSLNGGALALGRRRQKRGVRLRGASSYEQNEGVLETVLGTVGTVLETVLETVVNYIGTVSFLF